MTFEEKQSDGPTVADDDEIKILIANNQRYPTREIAEILHLSYTIVIKNLYKLRYMNHLLSKQKFNRSYMRFIT